MYRIYNLVLIIILFFIVLNQCYSQEYMFKFGIETNVGVSDRYFREENPLQKKVPKEVKDFIKSVEGERLGYDIGLILDYNPREKLSFQTGVKYVSWGYRSDKLDPISRGGYESFRVLEENPFIELIFRTNYYINLNKRISITAGFHPLINIANRPKGIFYFNDRTETIELNEEDVYESIEFRKFNFVSELGVSWEKEFFNMFTFYIRPNFKIQNCDNIIASEDSQLYRTLFFYGCAMGILYKIK